MAPTTDMMKPAGLSFLVPADGATSPGRRSGDADEHGDDDPAGVFARHDGNFATAPMTSPITASIADAYWFLPRQNGRCVPAPFSARREVLA